VAAVHFTPVLAHFGHWYISFPVYMGPVVALAAYVKWSGRRDRKRQRGRGVAADGDD
jgi:hypothetical protein